MDKTPSNNLLGTRQQGVRSPATSTSAPQLLQTSGQLEEALSTYSLPTERPRDNECLLPRWKRPNRGPSPRSWSLT